jgi:hypothetical protein
MGLLRRGQQAALWSRRHDAAYEGRSVRWKKDNVYGFLFVHLIAGLSFFPWFFSWTGVALLGEFSSSACLASKAHNVRLNILL